MPVAPQILEAFDDVSPQSGAVHYGAYTNDTAPLIRVSLGDQAAAGQGLALSENGAVIAQLAALSAAEVAQGYADVAVNGLPQGWNLLTATLLAGDGSAVATSMAFALGVATTTPATPSITGAEDDVGAATGALADGARTDDATPSLHVFEAGLPPTPTGSPGHAPYGGPALFGGRIEVYDGDQAVGEANLGYDGTVTLTTGDLAPGDHVLTAVAVDRAGNASAPSAAFHLTVAADGGVPSPEPEPNPGPVATHPTDGDDQLQAGPGFLEVHAGLGNDTIVGADADELLRGDAGADSISGGSRFNSINGNTGDDSIVGRSTVGDWLLGGQGDDRIDASASSGHNLVNGNLGDDRVLGGGGGDILRGGQGDDEVTGGAAADWLSGDLGHNTLAGGGGADTFHAGHGVDRVLDFSLAEGDRVLLDPGVVYTASQAGSDTVLDLAGGGQMILVGVSSASLTGGWIVQA